jgi:hypothetical protein
MIFWSEIRISFPCLNAGQQAGTLYGIVKNTIDKTKTTTNVLRHNIMAITPQKLSSVSSYQQSLIIMLKAGPFP